MASITEKLLGPTQKEIDEYWELKAAEDLQLLAEYRRNEQLLYEQQLEEDNKWNNW